MVSQNRLFRRLAQVPCLLFTLILAVINVDYLTGLGHGTVLAQLPIPRYYVLLSLALGIDAAMILSLHGLNFIRQDSKWYAALLIFLITSGFSLHSADAWVRTQTQTIQAPTNALIITRQELEIELKNLPALKRDMTARKYRKDRNAARIDVQRSEAKIQQLKTRIAELGNQTKARPMDHFNRVLAIGLWLLTILSWHAFSGHDREADRERQSWGKLNDRITPQFAPTLEDTKVPQLEHVDSEQPALLDDDAVPVDDAINHVRAWLMWYTVPDADARLKPRDAYESYLAADFPKISRQVFYKAMRRAMSERDINGTNGRTQYKIALKKLG